MKKYLLIIIFSSLNCLAIQSNDSHLVGGIGGAGARGLFGFSFDKFYTEHQALSLAAGIDIVGLTASVGYKYFGNTMKKETFIDKCFFYFDCDTTPYLGASLQYASALTTKISDANGEREYHSDPKWLGLVGFGFRNQFKNRFLLISSLQFGKLLQVDVTLKQPELRETIKGC
jgi:hypothetical protein